jgi:uncharacterized membrane protein YfcA
MFPVTDVQHPKTEAGLGFWISVFGFKMGGMQIFLVLVVIFFAVFTQTVTGFGSGLVAMAFLPGILDVRTAAPLVILVTSTLELILLIHLRANFRIRSVWRLMITTLLGIPLGVWGLRGLNAHFLLTALGVVIAGYALYAFFEFKLPTLEHPAWAFLAGFLSGLLGGAYSVSGPPAIIYANCRGWKPDEFKSNLQGFFLVGDGLTILNHAVVGNLTHLVWSNYLWALPIIALGLLAGAIVDRLLNPQFFRKLILAVLVIMGVRFILFGFI